MQAGDAALPLLPLLPLLRWAARRQRRAAQATGARSLESHGMPFRVVDPCAVPATGAAQSEGRENWEPLA